MTHRKPRTRRAWVLAGTGAAALAAVVAGGVAVVSSDGDSVKPEASSIDRMIPADADTAVIAPSGDNWWPKISSMAWPAVQVNNVDLAAAGVHVTHVGYSRSADNAERKTEDNTPLDLGPLRLVYLEVADEAQAAQLAEFVLESSAGSGAQAHVEGNVVVVSPSWVEAYTAPAEADSLAAKADLGERLSTGKAAMWFDPDAEVGTLARTPDAAEKYEGVVRHAMGFEEGTTWIGTSSDGDSWEGEFQSGGVDVAQIDFEATESDLSETETVISKAVVGDATIQLIDGGMADLLVAGGFTASTEDGPIGNDPATRSFTAVQGELVSSYGDMTEWNSAVEGASSGQREGVTSRYVSANEDEMVLSFEYEDTVS